MHVCVWVHLWLEHVIHGGGSKPEVPFERIGYHPTTDTSVKCLFNRLTLGVYQGTGGFES